MQISTSPKMSRANCRRPSGRVKALTLKIKRNWAVQINNVVAEANARVAAQHEAVVVGRGAIATDKDAVANASAHVLDLLIPHHAKASRVNRNHVVNEAALGVATVKLYNVTPVVTTSSSMTEFFTG